MTREEAINELQNNKQDYTYIMTAEAIDMAIKALEQEPTTKNDLAVSSKLDKNSKKLEKDFGEIRAEIDELPSYVARFNGGDFAIHIDKEKVLEIIDKYKAETEET